ncbi:SCO3242 family prenyltransferase [Streptomyces sp. NPDC014861]|uniref:SCO3242 family prenyltransferase n=1 Tax=Streptomyces sp. NPDC014861 TaxID=3364923 RepID=UPI0036F4DB73
MTGAPGPRPGTARAWGELLRVSALPSVPGDALAGAAAAGLRPGRGTAWAVGASVCLYEAGMALNDWADRHVDAVERPRRPLPSGRVAPAAALGAAGALTATGLALASRAGRPALAVASALAATVWAYDLRLKHTAAGPAAMAAARGLDVLLGALATAAPGRTRDTRPAVPNPPRTAATASGGRAGPAGRAGIDVLAAAAPSAAALAAHTYAVTAVSRHEADGGSTAAPAGALVTAVLLGLLTAGAGPYPPGEVRRTRGRTDRRDRSGPARGPRRATPRPDAGPTAPGAGPSPARHRRVASDRVAVLMAGAYLRTAAGPLLHAVLNPSPSLTRRAVGGGIRAMIPLQAVLAARSGSPVAGAALLGLAPVARRLARKVSPT